MRTTPSSEGRDVTVPPPPSRRCLDFEPETDPTIFLPPREVFQAFIRFLKEMKQASCEGIGALIEPHCSGRETFGLKRRVSNDGGIAAITVTHPLRRL